MRFLSPVLFAAAAGFVWWSNAQHTDRVYVLPFMDLLAPDPATQGEWSVRILLGLAVVFGIWDAAAWWRQRKESS